MIHILMLIMLVTSFILTACALHRVAKLKEVIQILTVKNELAEIVINYYREERDTNDNKRNV